VAQTHNKKSNNRIIKRGDYVMSCCKEYLWKGLKYKELLTFYQVQSCMY